MSKDVIVVMGYNRPKSLNRLLMTLNNSYFSDNVDLIISLDKSDIQKEVEKVANSFDWIFGEKDIILHKERLGLRNHVLYCGDLVENYEGLIMFEDDIVPSEYFYEYVKQTKSKYYNNEEIAGISLYSPSINEMVEKPFTPITSGFDTFFIQSASSWGQYWTKNMWINFREWYLKNSNTLENIKDMPDKIYSWPQTSWKKYFMKYLVETNKYFVYPYISLSTNFSDVGQHVQQEMSLYQVPIQMKNIKYKLPTFTEGIKYDSFFEIELESLESLYDGVHKICVDIYGSKKNYSNYSFLLSVNKLNYEIIETFGLNYKPQELNFLRNNPGDQIFLYDLSKEKKFGYSINKSRNLSYYTSLNWKDSMKFSLLGLLEAINKRLPIRHNFFKKR
ncbi:glycosyltransferase family 2 protein [Fundicoccus culcitae]|uniref:Glycosyltransferase family 2 protein n=1 Tax=Fundicoccus culcitae TaxID=2969821 RepID=A0ABY5P9V7_9LACT|nr:glycosyltransferase family 2 protein [Fundicoccus culcitae]UUX35240.1 glycosyltransferase family 2 protein [Fundicoccus culcitae]